MSTVLQLKRNETGGSIPSSGDLAVGELAINLIDKKLYSKKTDGTIIAISGSLPDDYYLSTITDYGSITDSAGTNLDLGSVADSTTSTLDLGDLTLDASIVAVPATSSSAGSIGQLASDSDYFYVCVDTNTWKRVSLSSW